MTSKRKFYILPLLTVLLFLVSIYAAQAWTPVAIVDDPLVRMPGTQPGQATTVGFRCAQDQNL